MSGLLVEEKTKAERARRKYLDKSEKMAALAVRFAQIEAENARLRADHDISSEKIVEFKKRIRQMKNRCREVPSNGGRSEIIQWFLSQQDTVFFVQVGANDGVRADPIREMIMQNEAWRGIFVEPVKYLFDRLKQNYGNSERFIFENVAIATKKGKQDFFYVHEDARRLDQELPEWVDMLGSFNKEHLLNYFEGRLAPHIITEEIECLPLSEMLAKNQVRQIDFLHIDTEGFDYKVLSQVDFSHFKPTVIWFEHAHVPKEEQSLAWDLLRKNGYIITEDMHETLAFYC